MSRRRSSASSGGGVVSLIAGQIQMTVTGPKQRTNDSKETFSSVSLLSLWQFMREALLGFVRQHMCEIVSLVDLFALEMQIHVGFF